MSEEQKRKIEDVMHTLSVIRDGKAVNCRASAKACYEVLDEVLHMEEPVNASEEKEPAPKEGERERPHQADCICRRCEDWDDAHEPAKVEAGEGLPPSSMAIEPMVGAWDLVDAIATGDEKSRFIAAELQQYRKASIVTNEAGHKEVKKILDQLKYALEENELLKSRIRDLERVYELGKNGNRSEAMTCPLPLHNPLRQKDGTYKCSECPKTWDENPTAKVIYPKGKR